MRRFLAAFREGFWVAFYRTAKQHAPAQVISLRIDVDDAQAHSALDRMEARLVAFEERAARLDQWTVRH